MDYSHVSPETYLLTEDDRTIEFKKYRYGDESKPSTDECKGKLKGGVSTGSKGMVSSYW